jgi:hypothetical protein
MDGPAARRAWEEGRAAQVDRFAPKRADVPTRIDARR